MMEMTPVPVSRLVKSLCLVCALVLAGLCASEAYAAPRTTNYCSRAQAQNRPCVGLVLSGGGARGLAHIGVLRALEELHVPVDIITATSMGSIVGGSYALGYRYKEIDNFARSVDWSTMFETHPERPSLPWSDKQHDMSGYSDAKVGVSTDGLHLPSGIASTQELHIFFSSFADPADSVTDLGTLPIPFAAMATDLETGERVVLHKNVRLEDAMRASMSVPGVFSPVELRGKLLVDGGLVDNLPVEYARELGAERLIVVNVGTPLSDRKALANVLGVMGQMVNILTEQNVRASKAKIRSTDVFIEPDLENYSSANFDKIDELSEIGYKTAMKQVRALKSLSMNETGYNAWARANHLFTEKSTEHDIYKIAISNVSKETESRILDRIDVKPDEVKTPEDIAELSRRIWSEGQFKTAPYHYEETREGTKLVFTPEFMPTGDSLIRLGASVETDFNSSSTFNLAFMHELAHIGSVNAKWTTELQIGNERHVATELNIPIGHTERFYVNPYLDFQSDPYNLYNVDIFDHRSEKHPSLRYRQEDLRAGVRLGMYIGNDGILYGDAGYLRERMKNDTSVVDIAYKANSWYAGGGFVYDTLDAPDFPSKGLYAKAYFTRFIKRSGDAADEIYSGAFLYPFGNGDWVGHVLVKGERATSGADIHMGGVFNYSGSSYGRFSGTRSMFSRVMVAKNIAPGLKRMNMPVYLGATLEAGRLWGAMESIYDEETKAKNIRAASLFLGFDSWIGPIYLVAGRTFGHSNAITLYWGRLRY